MCSIRSWGKGLSRVKIKKNMRVPGARLGKFKKSAAHAPDFNEMNYLVLYQTINMSMDPGLPYYMYI